MKTIAVHIASMGGTWMTLVYGFAGMRDYDGRISFRPRLPKSWDRLKFQLSLKGQTVEVDMNHLSTTYRLLTGKHLELHHEDDLVVLTPDAPEIVCAAAPAGDVLTFIHALKRSRDPWTRAWS